MIQRTCTKEKEGGKEERGKREDTIMTEEKKGQREEQEREKMNENHPQTTIASSLVYAV